MGIIKTSSFVYKLSNSRSCEDDFHFERQVKLGRAIQINDTVHQIRAEYQGWIIFNISEEAAIAEMQALLESENNY